MFSALAKSRSLQAALVLLPLAGVGLWAANGLGLRSPWSPFSAAARVPDGADAIARMRASLDADRARLLDYEKKQSRLRAEVIEKRKLRQAGQISEDEVRETEQAFVAALKQVYAMRSAVLGEKVERMPALPVNGFSETKELARFNGGFKWSLQEAPRVEKYFTETFGRRLPVTALGQSETHNRLGFDHRDSM